MIIDQVYGLQATAMSLNDRFTILAGAPMAPARARTPRRRPSVGGFYNQNMNRNLLEQIARRLEQQSKRQSLRQRLGVGPGALRRFGSESSLPGLRRANSFGDLSQRGIKSRVSWRQSNGNLNRTTSFGNLAASGRARGLRRRPRGTRGLRRARGGATFGRARLVGARPLRGRLVGRGATGGVRGAGRGAGRAARGRGRGGITRQTPKPVPTREELDQQLEQYMAGSRAALDLELDVYMKNAMDLE